MARGGGNRSRLLLVILLVTALFFITLDLRGVSLTKGSRSVTQTILSPVQKTVSTIFSPVGRFFSDVKNFGKTNAQLQEELALNKMLKSELAMSADTKGQLAQLKSVRSCWTRKLQGGCCPSYCPGICFKFFTDHNNRRR